jgi:hypothetical protein
MGNPPTGRREATPGTPGRRIRHEAGAIRGRRGRNDGFRRIWGLTSDVRIMICLAASILYTYLDWIAFI